MGRKSNIVIQFECALNSLETQAERRAQGKYVNVKRAQAMADHAHDLLDQIEKQENHERQRK